MSWIDLICLAAMTAAIVFMQRRLPTWRKVSARKFALVWTGVLAVVLGVSFASPHMHIVKCAEALNYHDCAVIMLTGDITDRDGQEFVERTLDIRRARVALHGPGGSTTAGIIIGEQIHNKGFDTFVPDDTVCASACANIWIAGRKRVMGSKSLLLWHSAFRKNDPENADGMGNVLVGVYLAHIGYNFADAIRLFGHDPNDVHGTYSDEHGNEARKNVRWNGTEFVMKLDDEPSGRGPP